jgi:hypothetical protein
MVALFPPEQTATAVTAACSLQPCYGPHFILS